MLTWKQVVVSCVMLFVGASCASNEKMASKKDAEALRPWNEKRVLWFTSPAEQWRYGLPVGNGRLGAMVQGTYPRERIQLNEDSIWAKEPMLRHPATTKKRIADVQKLVDAGNYKAAHDLYEAKIIMGDAPPIGSYQTMGDLWIDHVGSAKLQSDAYLRTLDVATGLVTVTKSLSDGSVITEEVLSSAVDDCIAIRLSSTSAEGLSIDVSMTHPAKKVGPAVVKGDDELLLEGQAQYDDPKAPYLGTKFYTVLKAKPEGGSITGSDGVLEVRGAKAVTMLLTCSTDFNKRQPQVPLSASWQKKAEETLAQAKVKPWSNIKKASMDDVSSMMYRCDVDLGTSAPRLTQLPTDQRLDTFKKTQTDPGLMELYFQFGRYLKVSSSRPGTMPTNLQGLWAEKLKNPWNCDYHLNINIQLHYLSVEPTNLSECHEPLFWLLDMLRIEGRKMAKSYGAKGFCTNHGVGPWGRTINSARRARWGGSVISVHWVVMNIMEHYRFTGDTAFLRDTGWPILKESCEFVQSWVIRDHKTGKWVGKASTSHETGFNYKDENGQKRVSEIGPVTAYDLSIIWQVMSDTLEAAAVLGVDDGFTKAVDATLAELEMPRISKQGHILEWGIEEATEVDMVHRHLSHLVGFHPGRQITKSKTPALFEAAKQSLARRGNRTMGWSQSWKTSCYARLLDGNAALGQFKQLLTEQTQPNLLNLAGRTLNLDGNYGTPAGVVEMLMQSHEGDVHLLPALADEWKDGSARGMLARGGFEVDMDWKDGKLVKAEILSRLGGELTIRYGDERKTHDTRVGQRIAFKY
jgi:alpha-L-fucosidase 2